MKGTFRLFGCGIKRGTLFRCWGRFGLGVFLWRPSLASSRSNSPRCAAELAWWRPAKASGRNGFVVVDSVSVLGDVQVQDQVQVQVQARAQARAHVLVHAPVQVQTQVQTQVHAPVQAQVQTRVRVHPLAPFHIHAPFHTYALSHTRKTTFAALFLALVLGLGALTGCSSVGGSSVAAAGAAVEGSGGSGSDSDSSSGSATTGDFAVVAAAFDAALLDLEYSKRDLDASFDDASATHVVLSGASGSVEGAGASVEGSVVTLSAEGTYVISGALSDGQLVVEAPDTAKVQVVLDGVTIHNEDGPAVYVKEADKCFITLAEGSKNVLSDGAGYALEADSDEPYATLFSRADLTLNGSGALSVTSAYRHAVCSKDDLVITGGTYVVNAVEDALRGRDCVKIKDGTFTITAGGDGIKSNNDGDSTRGFVSLDGGTYTIDAGDEGIQGQTYLRVAGGEFSITSADDALHSNLEALIAGGSMTISAVDDAVHAETKLVIDDGTVNITQCYEGYEAEKIYVNGGTTHIVADDDAVNASAADLTSTESTSTDAAATATGTSAAPGASSSGNTQVPSLPEGATAPEGAPSADGTFDPSASGAPQGGFGAATGTAPSAGESTNERSANGGKPDNAFNEGGAGGMGMGDENCLVQISGGYTVLESGGDSVDSNGSVEVTGGVLLVNGPTSGGDGAFDYDLTATVTGGTVLMVGSAGMAQNFTSGTQPFAFTTASGQAGQSVAIVDGDDNVVASLKAAKQFGMVLATSPSFTEGGSYSVVVGGDVSGANADGYTDSGTLSSGTETSITASTTATGGMGGLGAGGGGMPAGQGGTVQRGMRGAA